MSRTWLFQELFDWLTQGLNCKIENSTSYTAARGCETLYLLASDLEKQVNNVVITLHDKLDNIYKNIWYSSLTYKSTY